MTGYTGPVQGWCAGAASFSRMKNLTRDEARARAALLDVASYDVALDLTTGDEHFASTSVVAFGCREPGTTSFVELDGELVSAELNGSPVGPLEGNRIPLPDLQADNLLTVHARCAYSRTGEGLHRFVDPADGETYLYAQSFLDDAQRQFACFDQPGLKATFRLRVQAPPRWSVVSNARGTHDDGRWEFVPTERISTYLFTVAAGPWHTVTGHHDGIDLGLHCRQSLAEYLDADAAELFEVTAQCLDFQQAAFGRRYPFGDTYDQLFVPEFNAGAMENPGAVTFAEMFVFRSRTTDDKRRQRAMVIAHEMSHMWFGDLVTMRWWDDLWLNESFAELMGFLTVDRATRFTDAWVDFSATRKAWGYRADQLPSTHPVQGDVPDNRSALLNFDGISYAKGASVLRQLMATVGEQVFFAAVRAYFERHAFANTTFADLLAELEAASGRDLQEWSRVWLQTSGVSTLRAVVEGDVRVVQEASVLRPHRIGVGLYDLVDDGLALRERLDVEVEGEGAVLELDVADRPDLLLPNDGDDSFAKLRFDDRSLATVLSDLRRLPDPLARALCWAALWDACRDAELPAADFVCAVLAGVDGESDPAVVATLLQQARTAARLYTADGARLLDRLAQASHVAAVDAEPGSDLQLVRLRAVAASADVTRAGALQAVLHGSDVLPGLTVDTELRWHLVECLAALGAVDDDGIDAELARDATAAGRLHALTARASRPDAAAKDIAWTALTGDADLSNHESAALAAGFWQAGQDVLLRPYVDRYVADLPAVWDARTPQVAGTLAQRLFPSTLVEQGVLDATAPLERGDHPAGLRRYVAEARDDLARALRARAVS
jgi:aminopeptidase N